MTHKRCDCGKLIYTKEEADKQCDIMARRFNEPFKAYECPGWKRGGVWHVTNANPILSGKLLIGNLSKNNMLSIKTSFGKRYLVINPNGHVPPNPLYVLQWMHNGDIVPVATQERSTSPWYSPHHIFAQKLAGVPIRHMDLVKESMHRKALYGKSTVEANKAIGKFVIVLEEKFKEVTVEKIIELTGIPDDEIRPVVVVEKKEVVVEKPKVVPVVKKERKQQRIIKMSKKGVHAWEYIKRHLTTGEASISTVVETLIVTEYERRKS